MSADRASQQLEELTQVLQMLDREKRVLEQERAALRQERRAIDDAIETLEGVEAGDTVKVPLGGGAYVSAEITSLEDVLVEVGDALAAEQPRDPAISLLETRKDLLGDHVAELSEEIEELGQRADRVEEQATSIQNQLRMAVQQQFQGGDQDS